VAYPGRRQATARQKRVIAGRPEPAASGAPIRSINLLKTSDTQPDASQDPFPAPLLLHSRGEQQSVRRVSPFTPGQPTAAAINRVRTH
jgi:hypothetical protein